jgi:alcohol oxidase
MKPREQNGVVDSKLNVYGTQNLKVAGKSLVFPRSLSTPTIQSADEFPRFEHCSFERRSEHV